jgi:hypothetical protein
MLIVVNTRHSLTRDTKTTGLHVQHRWLVTVVLPHNLPWQSRTASILPYSAYGVKYTTKLSDQLGKSVPLAPNWARPGQSRCAIIQRSKAFSRFNSWISRAKTS